MLNLIGKEPAHERRIEPEEDSMGRRVDVKCGALVRDSGSRVSWS